MEEAEDNMEKDMPPSEEAEFEWMKMERSRIWKEKESIDRAQKAAAEALLPSTVTKTTAEPRPNAYFLDDVGIPKPYGKSAPFKPTEPGATMRHIRKPKIPEIEI